MKILAIDDQQLVLLPLQKHLTEQGYEVKTLVSSVMAVEVYETFLPDLVIIDINMPTISGIDIIKYIRKQKGDQTPIMVLSGNTEDAPIVEAFELGVQDYMKKPLSLNELSMRVKRLIGTPNHIPLNAENEPHMIPKKCVGLVIPCYNEGKRLLTQEFIDFVEKHAGYHLCFVNDGSKDLTLEILNGLKVGREDFVSIYSFDKHRGKAEAIRTGMLYLAEREDLDYIGYLDANIATGLHDFTILSNTIATSNYQIVSGYGLAKSNRNLLSNTLTFLAKYITQQTPTAQLNCANYNAKIMTVDFAKIAFKDKFKTKRAYNLEVLLRLRNHFGSNNLQHWAHKMPISWKSTKTGKLTFAGATKIIKELITLSVTYKSKKVKNKYTHTAVNIANLQDV